MQNRVFRFLSKHRLGVMIGVCIPFILAVYLFFVSAATWRSWPEYTRYYDDLATAFQAGHLYLDTQPSATLLSFPDPYDPQTRNQVPALKAFVERVRDLSFYRGRFYLYWGPAPALLLSVLKLFYAEPIPDQYLVFGFLVGLLMFTVLLILELRRGYYQNVPISMVLIGILVAGLACPIPWMLSRAAIYEATIAGGQFFLIGGLYIAYSGLKRQPASRAMLLLAGVFWALAAASRTLALIPAAFMTLMLVSWEATNGGEARPGLKTIPKALILGLPLAFSALILGWYDWARFGSVLQTGLRYTLTFRDLDRFYAQCFSVFYALPSLWMYLFNPFQTQSGFPFISALPGKSPSILYLGGLNTHLYYAEAVTGLLFSVPFVLFSVVATINTVALISRTHVEPAVPMNDPRGRRLLWISLCLAGSAFLSFTAILFYFNVTMRFMAEFLPSLIPFSLLGVWQGYNFLQGRPVIRDLYTLSAIGLGVATVAVSLLLTVTQYQGGIQHHDPHVIRQLMLLLGR